MAPNRKTALTSALFIAGAPVRDPQAAIVFLLGLAALRRQPG